MFEDLLRHPVALGLSVGLHVLLVALLVVGYSLAPRRVTQPVASAKPIEATAVDARKIEQGREQRLAAEQARKRADAERKAEAKREAEEAARRAQAEHQRKAEAAKKKAEAERIAEVKRKEAEAQQLAEAKRKAEAEAKRKAEAEAKRKAEAEAKRKAEAEAKRKAEAEAKRKAEAEAKRKAEEEARRKAEEEARRRAETELKAQLAAEERQRELVDKLQLYKDAITQKITRNWRRPIETGRQPDCKLIVEQLPGGLVADVRFLDCPGSAAYRDSVEKAVYKAEPLPDPGDPELFALARQIEITFYPEN
jgi:colicin import membrane protein